jgi:PTS system nitrogen regulatory IIA component
MNLDDLIASDAILPTMRVANKKQAIVEISEKAAQVSGLKARDLFEVLWQRESLGSTSVGDGIAIPHAKMPKLGRMFVVAARLEKPIDFDALDGSPVDLIFALIAPETAGADHLKALAQLARTLRQDSLVSALRATRDAAGIYMLLTSETSQDAA